MNSVTRVWMVGGAAALLSLAAAPAAADDGEAATVKADAWGEDVEGAPAAASIETDATLPFSSADIYRALASRLDGGALPMGLPVIRIARLGPTRVLIDVGNTSEALDLPDRNRAAGARDVALVLATMLHGSGALAVAPRAAAAAPATVAIVTPPPAAPTPTLDASIDATTRDADAPVAVAAMTPRRRVQVGAYVYPGIGVRAGIARRVRDYLWIVGEVGLEHERYPLATGAAVTVGATQVSVRGGPRLEWRWLALESGLRAASLHPSCSGQGGQPTQRAAARPELSLYAAASLRVPLTPRLRAVGELALMKTVYRQSSVLCAMPEITGEPSLVSFAGALEYAF
jgi:hypothetical protein